MRLLPYSCGFIEQTISHGLACMRHMLTWWCGNLPAGSGTGVALRKPSREISRANCWLITLRLRSTGRKTSTTKLLPAYQLGLSDMSYKFRSSPWQVSTACGSSMFDPTRLCQGEGMKLTMLRKCSSRMLPRRMALRSISHQQEVGTGYFDKVTTIIQGGARRRLPTDGST